MLADGGYLPPGTTKELCTEEEARAIYTLTFPDHTTVKWFRGGRVPHAGMPGRIKSGIVVATKRHNPRKHRKNRTCSSLGPEWISIE